MPRYGLLLTLCFLGASITAAQGNRATEDLKTIQGKWKVQSCLYDGKEVAAEVGNGWTFTNNKLKVESAPEEMTITLNAAKRPKEMELRVGTAPQPVKGIYAVENESLKFCYGTKENDSRPDRFESKSGSGRLLITLKRTESQESEIAQEKSDDGPLSKKEIELLKKEIELLKKENEALKNELAVLKKGGEKRGGAKETEEPKDSVMRVTLDNVEYVYAGASRNGNTLIVSVMATSKDGQHPAPRGQMTLIDENGDKHTGRPTSAPHNIRELREGVPIKLQWQFGGTRPFVGDRGPQAPSAKLKKFTAVIIERSIAGSDNTIEFRNVPNGPVKMNPK